MAKTEWKQKQVRLDLEHETETDRQVIILIRMKLQEKYSVPHECSLFKTGKGTCPTKSSWHRSAKLVGLQIGTAHDSYGRLEIWIKGVK